MYAASGDELVKLKDDTVKFKDFKEKNNTSCPICFLDFEDDDDISNLSCCKTTFHYECIDKWLSECNHTCPLCRKEFDKNEVKL